MVICSQPEVLLHGMGGCAADSVCESGEELREDLVMKATKKGGGCEAIERDLARCCW